MCALSENNFIYQSKTTFFFFCHIFMQCLGEMSEGDAFGELALFQNSTRTATIVCKTACEFLKIDKEDFNQVKFFHLTFNKIL